MAIYNIINEKYNINFDLKLDTFYNFIESLKESKKYYYDYCNLKNINIKDFDNEYIDNINKLEGELLKYYILITDDNDVEKFVVINDIIKELYFVVTNILNTIAVNKYKLQNSHSLFIHNQIINESFNINYLTRSKLYNLIKIYAYDNCQPFWPQRIRIKDWLKDIIPGGSNSSCETNFIKELNKYLDSLDYVSNNFRELQKIVITLPDICISNIQSKKLLNNISNEQNLINLNEDLDDKYIAVD